MGILKSVGDFLFGKDPEIFDEAGEVRHHFPEKKWQQWNARLQGNPSYDWRNHGAQSRAMETETNSDKKSGTTSSPKN